jgi:hypothetical protein
MDIQVDFQLVRKDESEKQSYLNRNFYLLPQSVSKIVYDPDLAENYRHAAALVQEGVLDESLVRESPGPSKDKTKFSVIIPRGLVGAKRKHPIFVTDLAFQKLGIEELFLNSLIDHEGFHCEDLMNGIRLSDGTVIDQSSISQLQDAILVRMLEIRAYHNQIAQAHKKGITHELYFQYNQWALQSEIDLIQQVSPQSDLERILTGNPYKIFL